MLKMFLDDQEDIPWDSLNYMTGEINYGGRVTDHWDLRCLMEMLKKFYCPEALDEGYFFDEEEVYFCPKVEKWQDFMNYIDSLPLVDNPSVFGLSSNANISY
jgi:dynein heavy chain